MCGLFGSLTKKGIVLDYSQRKTRNQIIKGLAVSMQERGDNSTGIAGIFSDTMEIIKKAVKPEEFVGDEKFLKLLKKNPKIIMGHTRFATTGAVTNRNSHPFNCGNIIGCHNGHVTNYKEIFEEQKEEGEVDSEAIFILLNKYGNNFKKAFPELYGTFALTWVDLRNLDKLYMVRDGNPLFLIRVPELSTYFWCSTEQSLKTAIAPFFSLVGKEIWAPKAKYTYEMGTSFQFRKSPIEFKTTLYGKKEDEDDKKSEIINLQKLDDEDASKMVADIVGQKSLVPMSYFQRTGCRNPFTKEPISGELLDEHYSLMNLDISEIQKIVTGLTSGGCIMCDKNIDFLVEGGVFWHKKEQGLLCMQCKHVLNENRENLIWLLEKDVDDLWLEYNDWKVTILENERLGLHE